ncbi:hypothetical protein OKW40_005452 [Paraburkholderia sp. RAU6.4a]
MPVQRQRNHQPYDLLRGQPTPTYAGTATGLHCILDPFVWQMLTQPAPIERRPGFNKEAQIIDQHGDES